MTSEPSVPVLDFETHRPVLLGVAYRMLGSATEAEDIVQDAYLRASAAGVPDVADPHAFLVTIVTRLCLDYLKSARVRREQYVGPWLPEPILTDWPGAGSAPERAVALRESLSLAFLVVLERLSPLERAVFLLHDVFDFAYGEVAGIVGRNATACRQLLHRARKNLEAARPRYTSTEEQRRRITERFLFAAAAGDVAGLVQLLAADATACSDGGGKAVSARRVVRGASRVARFVVGVARKEPPERVDLVNVNGGPALVTWRGGRPAMVMAFDIVDGRVSQLLIVRNPDKLGRVSAPISIR